MNKKNGFIALLIIVGLILVVLYVIKVTENRDDYTPSIQVSIQRGYQSLGREWTPTSNDCTIKGLDVANIRDVFTYIDGTAIESGWNKNHTLHDPYSNDSWIHLKAKDSVNINDIGKESLLLFKDVDGTYIERIISRQDNPIYLMALRKTGSSEGAICKS